MSALLCLQALRNKWLEESEIQRIQEGFDAVQMALDKNTPEQLIGLPAFVSLLYVTCLNNKESLDKMGAMLNHDISEIPQYTASEELVWDAIWIDLQWNRTGMLNEKINARKSLTHSDSVDDFISNVQDNRLEKIYNNQSDKLNIDFVVQRLPFPLEVLDPRIVTIPPHKTNELHKHAHETVFIFIAGSGHVKVDGLKISVVPGDFVFIPRWCLHQSVNESNTDMVFLAVADFGITGKSFTGSYLKTARMKTE
jgi:quercetin dioxygenase-like cupin family protein